MGLSKKPVKSLKFKENFKPSPLPDLSRPAHLPQLFYLLIQEVIPAFVKKNFSPQSNWAHKPFSQEDVVFFSKGLDELSAFFSEQRVSSKLPNYFTTAKFRSSYFLYFFALQASKFLALFEKHPLAIQSILAQAKKRKELHIVDLGAGPGTASVAFLIFYFHQLLQSSTPKTKVLPFKIRLTWVDHNKTIMEEGKLLLFDLLSYLPELEGDIQVDLQVRPWWEHPKDFGKDATLILFGNVLNESAFDSKIFQTGIGQWLSHLKSTECSLLFMEPAFKESSQRLSQIRDELLTLFPELNVQGPCLHRESCPLAHGRDWCHFSVPMEIQSEWFRKFSIRLGSVREWAKFSYLWLDHSPTLKKSALFRIVSDPIRKPHGVSNQVCLPQEITWTQSSVKPKYYRGALVQPSSLMRQNLNPKNKPTKK